VKLFALKLVSRRALAVAALTAAVVGSSARAVTFDLSFANGTNVAGGGVCVTTLLAKCRFGNVVQGAGTGPYQRDAIITFSKTGGTGTNRASLGSPFDNDTVTYTDINGTALPGVRLETFAPTVVQPNVPNGITWAEFTVELYTPGTNTLSALPGTFHITSFDTDGSATGTTDTTRLREFVEYIGAAQTGLAAGTKEIFGTAVDGGTNYVVSASNLGVNGLTNDPQFKVSALYNNISSFKFAVGGVQGTGGNGGNGSRLSTYSFQITDSVIFAPDVEGYKSVRLTSDANGDGVVSTGDILTYSVTYANTGNAAVSNFQIADTLPGGLIVATGAQTVTGATREPNYNGGANANLLAAGQILAAGNSITVSIPVTVGTLPDNAMLLNQAGATVSGTTINTDNVDSTTVFPPSVTAAGVSVPAGSLAQTQESTVDKTSVVVRRSPLLTLNKTIVSRVNTSDQFTVQLKSGSIVTASASTSGTGTTASTNVQTLTDGTTYTLTEVMAAGSVSPLNAYNAALTCTNATPGSATSLPGGAGQSFAVTPRLGDVITCTLTNTATYAISGQVYEDYNYGGGAGRAYNSGQGMSLRPGVRVELYSAAGGNVLATALTNASGAYTFTGQLPGNYKVRVVNGFVTSSRVGGCAQATDVSTPPATCTQLPVQTYINGNAAQVGGANPAGADPALSTGALPVGALSVASVTVGTASVTGVDFGFNFSTVVNRGSAGQGSLRQFIVNANGLANTGLAQNGNRGTVATGVNEALPAARDTSIFMIPSAELTGGVAVIPVSTSVLPAITRSNISIDGTTQGSNIGNSNPGTLGTGGTVGYLNTATLDTVQRPEVQIVGTPTLAVGLDAQANSTQMRGLSIYGFGNVANNDNNANIRIGNDFTAILIEANIIGSSASAFPCGAATTVASRTSNADNIRSVGGDAGTVRNNLIGCAAGKGFGVEGSSVGWLISDNEIRGNGIGNTNLDGIDLESSGSKNHAVRGNLIVENAGVGVDGYQGAGGNLIERNTITGNGVAQGDVPRETAGVRIYSSNNTVKNNVIALNYGAGVLVTDTSAGNLISQNSMYDNGTVLAANGAAASAQVGIDLNAPGESVATGTVPYVTRNDSGDTDAGGNSLLNFPVFETAQIIGSTLQLTGYARAGSTIELFIAAVDASGFGEGKTYLLTLTEGSGQDADTGTGTYNNSMVGTDTTNRFKFTVALPAGVGLGTRLTATATCLGTACTGTTVTANSTSEFSYNIPVTGQPPSLTLSKLGRNISTTPVGTFIGGDGSIGVKPGETVEYCIVYTNVGGAASNFVLKDYVPLGMVIVPNAYSAGKGVRYASGTTVAVGAAAAPAGLDLTNASDTDEGTLDGTPVTNPNDPAGSPQRPGLMTLSLANVPASSTGTVCFQAKVP
jgi:uncharacterized repeat protein (TIGR01451 family)